MDAPALALFSMIRATRGFEAKGCTSPAPLPTTTRAAAGRAAEALTTLMVRHANRVEQPQALTLRGLREHVRECDSLLVRGQGMPPDALLAIWGYRQELVRRMADHEGGAELAEVMDMMPDGARARRLAEEAAAPSVLDQILRAPPKPEPETVPRPNPPPALPDPGEAAPRPPAPAEPVPARAQAAPAAAEPEPVGAEGPPPGFPDGPLHGEAAARIVGDSFRHYPKPIAAIVGAFEAADRAERAGASGLPPLELTEAMRAPPEQAPAPAPKPDPFAGAKPSRFDGFNRRLVNFVDGMDSMKNPKARPS